MFQEKFPFDSEINNLIERGSIEFKFQIPGYEIVYCERSPKALIVTFRFMHSRKSLAEKEHKGWGYEFLKLKDLSALHVIPKGNCWFRRPSLEHLFRELREAGFFDRFDQVMTYGGSMGGFGALSFCALTKAKRCLALNPQINLGPEVRSWETRFGAALRQDWTSELCNIDQQISGTETVAVIYDPYERQDRLHAELIHDPRVQHLHIPFVGHNIPAHLVGMNIASAVFDQCLDGTIDGQDFAKMVRARRRLKRYKNTLSRKAENKPHRLDVINQFLDGPLVGME